MLNHALRNRQRNIPSSVAVRVWLRRVRSLLPLLQSDLRATRLRIRGASIDRYTFLAPLHVGGPGRFLEVGEGTFIGRVTIELGEKVTIGRNVSINDGVKLLTASHEIRDPAWGFKVAPIVIEDFAWVAMDAIILPGVKIGYGAVVGAGAVVSKDVPAFGLATGNPIVIREDRRCRELSYSPVRFVGPLKAWLECY